MFTTQHHTNTDLNTSAADECATQRIRHRRRWFTVVLAMASANVVYTIADPLLGIELTAQGGSGEIHVGLLSVTASSLLAGFAAWGLLAMLERMLPQPTAESPRPLRPRTLWTWIAVATYVVSLAGTFGATSTSAVVALASLHTVVAAVLVVGMRRAS